MILKGNPRANGRDLALHLMNVEDNEHAVLHELRGFVADDLIGAFKEAEAISLGTQCQQYLFSLSLNPPKTARVSVDEFERVIAEIECRLGLSGQPRAIVFHEKKGRRHAHCVWSRIDVGAMKAVRLPHFKRRLMDVARELYLAHGWEMPAGFERAEDANPNAFDHAEAGQAKRAKRDPETFKAMFKACWAGSDSRASFAAALWSEGYALARGDRRGFVAVDAQGEVYSLSRWCGVKPKELRARLGRHDDLQTVEEAVALLNGNSAQDREAARQSEASGDGRSARLAELVARQREERANLQAAQDARRIAAVKARQARLLRGMKAVWAKITGQYDRIVKEIETEAETAAAGDRAEMQGLIDRHLTERRALDRQQNANHLQQLLEREFAARTEARRVYRPDPMQPLVLPRETPPFTVRELRAKPDLILSHLSDKQARFTRTDILRGLAAFIDDPLELRVALDKALASAELVRLDAEPMDYTTKDFQTAEQQLAATIHEMAHLGNFRVVPRHVDRAIARESAKLQKQAGARLSDEQINAIRHVTAPGQLSTIVGLAGAGKSTLLNAAREAWERQGYRVHGAALAGKAADSLQAASGIPSRTLASLEASWKSGYEPIGTGDIVVIDEAGMVGTRQLARVADQLRQRGCKLLLVGDPEQLQPIEAGTPFKDIVATHGAARLTEIHRQKEDWQRRASRDLAAGETVNALHAYADHGAMREERSCDHAIATLVDDYMADWRENPDRSRLALAHRRKDVHAINQAIRSARRARNEAVEENLFETDHGPRIFAIGDRILFTRNNAALNLRNGMLGTVTKIGTGQLMVELDAGNDDAPRRITFAPETFPAIDHGFAVSIHRAQGATVDRSFILDSRSMDKHLTYVAMTRHREHAALYTAPEIARKSERDRQVVHAPRNFSTVDFRPKAPTRTR